MCQRSVWLVGLLLALAVGCGASHERSSGQAGAAAAAESVAGCGREPASLSLLAFPTTSDGWVVAAESPSSPSRNGLEVLATRDGGSGWRCQWRGSLTPVQLAAIDPDHAWILGWQGSGCWDVLALSRCRSVVVGTSDGTHWSLLGRPSQGITQLAFASADLGLAAARDRKCGEPEGLPPARCAGHVLLTTDAGRHWHAVLRTPDPVVGVAISHGVLWAVETRLGVASKFGRQPGLVVLASRDSGRSWTQTGTIGLWLGSLRQQMELIPSGGGQLWLSVLDLDGCAMHGCGPDDLWRSSDRGRTWRLADPVDRADRFPGLGCGVIGPILLALDRNGGAWAAEGPNQATCELPATTLFDLANTNGENAASGWAVAHRWASFRPVAMAWPSASVGYLLGPGGLTRTADTGRSFIQLLPAPSPTVALDAMGATSAYGAQEATDDGAVLGTTDGGRHWTMLADLPSSVTRVDFVSPKFGFAVGAAWIPDHGPVWELYATFDGGQSWTRQATLPVRAAEQVSGLWMSSTIWGLMLVSSGYIWPQIYGGVGPAALWQTHDGGQTWTKLRTVPLPSPQVLTSASFTRAPHNSWAGWLLAGPSGVESTTDTGRHWQPLPGAPSLDGADLLSPDVGVGWNGSHNGRIVMWLTAGNGAHWTPLPLPAAIAAGETEVSNQLSVNTSFASPRVGWLLADGATWRSVDGGHLWERAGPTPFGG